MLDDPNLENLGNNFSAEYSGIVTYGEQTTLPSLSSDFQRYGYAWSFRSVTVRLAAVLILRALFAIGHVMLLLWTGWVSDGWRSPGEIDYIRGPCQSQPSSLSLV